MTAATAERDIFAPPKLPGMRSGLALAIAAHVLLIVAIAWSVHWKASEPEGVEAELWAAVPQTAAPRVEAPQPPPQPQPRPTPPPPVVQLAPPTPVQQDAQIAIERERAAREKARQEELQRAEAARRAEELKKREDAKKLEAERQRLADEAEKKKLAEQAKKDEARQASIREANLKRMMKEAGGSDDPLASGNAARTAGPSADYAGRIKARIKPNILLAAPIEGNPAATVEVKVAPDGTIVGKKLVTASNSKLWDETVLRAIDKTGELPKDKDGRVPPTIVIEFRPRD
jgi:colicin import membrane protein